MYVQFHTLLRYAALAILTIALLSQSSCEVSIEPEELSLDHDPDETVTVEVTGVSGGVDRTKIEETLEGMTEGSNHVMTSSWSGDEMTIKVSPVDDVEAFSQGIDFGEVTEVEGNTIKVEFNQ